MSPKPEFVECYIYKGLYVAYPDDNEDLYRPGSVTYRPKTMELKELEAYISGFNEDETYIERNPSSVLWVWRGPWEESVKENEYLVQRSLAIRIWIEGIENQLTQIPFLRREDESYRPAHLQILHERR